MPLPTQEFAEWLTARFPNMFALLAGASMAALGAFAVGFLMALLMPMALEVGLYLAAFFGGAAGGYKLFQRRATGVTGVLWGLAVGCGAASAVMAWLIIDYSVGHFYTPEPSYLHLAGYAAAGITGSVLGARLRLRFEEIVR